MWTDEIVQGDAYELIKQVPDRSVDLIVTDPPYQIEGVHQGTGVLRYRKMGYVDQLMQDGNRIVNGIDNSILDEMCRVMKRINVYLWCNKEQIANYLDYFVAKRGCNFEFIIWCKQNPPPFYGTHYLKDKEYCLYFWETGVKLDIPSFDRGRTVFFTNVNREDKERWVHPTIKPQGIVSRMIENSSAPGGVVLDPFVGSGTTCAAARMLGRHWLGFELDERYAAIAKARVSGCTMVSEDGDVTYEQQSLF